MQDKFINKKSNKEIVMLIHIMLCYKPKLIKTLKPNRNITGLSEPEKWPSNQVNVLSDKSGISNQQIKNGLYLSNFSKIR